MAISTCSILFKAAVVLACASHMVKAQPKSDTCTSTVTIGFALDVSGSVDSTEYDFMQNAVADFVEKNSGYSTGALNANSYYSSAWDTSAYTLQAAPRTNEGNKYADFTRNLPRPGSGGTVHSVGIQDLFDNLQAGDYGILLTDSASVTSFADTEILAKKLKNKLAKFIIIGVNLPEDSKALIDLASPGEYYGDVTYDNTALLAAIGDAALGACPLVCEQVADIIIKSGDACTADGSGKYYVPACADAVGTSGVACATPYLSGAVDPSTLKLTKGGADVGKFGDMLTESVTASAMFSKKDSAGKMKTFNQSCTGSVKVTFEDADKNGVPDCAEAVTLPVMSPPLPTAPPAPVAVTPPPTVTPPLTATPPTMPTPTPTVPVPSPRPNVPRNRQPRGPRPADPSRTRATRDPRPMDPPRTRAARDPRPLDGPRTRRARDPRPLDGPRTRDPRPLDPPRTRRPRDPRPLDGARTRNGGYGDSP